MSSLGISQESQVYEQIAAGPIEIDYCTADLTGATVAIGQVLKYDSAAYNYVNATDVAPDAAGCHVVVCAETKTITADGAVKCIVSGRVNFGKLDTTSQAFNHIKALLRANGIIPVVGV